VQKKPLPGLAKAGQGEIATALARHTVMADPVVATQTPADAGNPHLHLFTLFGGE
jgi:hypothetical protein